jgi:hypothetical protein
MSAADISGQDDAVGQSAWYRREHQTMRKTRAFLVAAATMSALVGAATSASAAPATYQEPTVQSISTTVLASSADSGFALVQARYRCYGGDTGTHLFIAVKQGPDVSPVNPSSSPSMTGFYSTNYKSDGPGMSLHCDGASHSQVFRLKNDPYWLKAQQNLPLTSGPALVQFCLFDSTSTENSDTGFVFDYEMKTVRVLH